MEWQHGLALFFLVVFFILPLLIPYGIMWGVSLAYTILLAFLALNGSWPALMFAPILGIFVFSLIMFIKISLEGELLP